MLQKQSRLQIIYPSKHSEPSVLIVKINNTLSQNFVRLRMGLVRTIGKMNRNIISVNYQNIFCIRCLFPAMLCTHDSNRFQFQYLACIHTNNVTFKGLIYFIYDPLWGAARALFVRHHSDVICNQH